MKKTKKTAQKIKNTKLTVLWQWEYFTHSAITATQNQLWANKENLKKEIEEYATRQGRQ